MVIRHWTEEVNIGIDPNVRTKGERGGYVRGDRLNEEHTTLRYMVTGSVTV